MLMVALVTVKACLSFAYVCFLKFQTTQSIFEALARFGDCSLWHIRSLNPQRLSISKSLIQKLLFWQRVHSYILEVSQKA